MSSQGLALMIDLAMLAKCGMVISGVTPAANTSQICGACNLVGRGGYDLGRRKRRQQSLPE